jgi:hypothetical protein
MCPSASRPPALKWYGVAIDGKGFFAIDNVGPLPRVQPENLAYVLVDDPKASVAIIEDGLEKLVCADWDWQVECLSETDFSVVFLNAISLQLCKNAADLALPGSKIRIIVLDSICNPPGAPPPLSEIWTRVHGLPPCLLEAERLKAALEMVGKPILVDAVSLLQDPKAMRVQFLVHVHRSSSRRSRSASPKYHKSPRRGGTRRSRTPTRAYDYDDNEKEMGATCFTRRVRTTPVPKGFKLPHDQQKYDGS